MLTGEYAAKSAPCGSWMTEKVPTVGISISFTHTLPPSSSARAVVAFTSGVPM